MLWRAILKLLQPFRPLFHSHNLFTLFYPQFSVMTRSSKVASARNTSTYYASALSFSVLGPVLSISVTSCSVAVIVVGWCAGRSRSITHEHKPRMMLIQRLIEGNRTLEANIHLVSTQLKRRQQQSHRMPHLIPRAPPPKPTISISISTSQPLNHLCPKGFYRTSQMASIDAQTVSFSLNTTPKSSGRRSARATSSFSSTTSITNFTGLVFRRRRRFSVLGRVG